MTNCWNSGFRLMPGKISKHIRSTGNGACAGAEGEIVRRFSDIAEPAAQGKLDHWSDTSRGRLASIIALVQFSRSIWRDDSRAYAQDPKVLALVREGFENGHFDQLETIWEKTFYQMPLGHCEGPDQLDRAGQAIEIGMTILADAPQHLKPLYEFSAQQPVEGRKVIAAFGRHPHRNAVLGRKSTPAELAFLKIGKFPHQREIEF